MWNIKWNKKYIIKKKGIITYNNNLKYLKLKIFQTTKKNLFPIMNYFN
jgi:hypothetical protein